MGRPSCIDCGKYSAQFIAVYWAITAASLFAVMTPVNASEERLVRYHTGAAGAEVRGFLVTPDAKGRTPAILAIHDWRGLGEDIKEQARKYADTGYTVFAIDTFDGKKPATREIAQPIST